MCKVMHLAAELPSLNTTACGRISALIPHENATACGRIGRVAIIGFEEGPSLLCFSDFDAHDDNSTLETSKTRIVPFQSLSGVARFAHST
jgi:hypothetical protein